MIRYTLNVSRTLSFLLLLLACCVCSEPVAAAHKTVDAFSS
jgi:hypothetical protein